MIWITHPIYSCSIHLKADTVVRQVRWHNYSTRVPNWHPGVCFFLLLMLCQCASRSHTPFSKYSTLPPKWERNQSCTIMYNVGCKRFKAKLSLIFYCVLPWLVQETLTQRSLGWSHATVYNNKHACLISSQELHANRVNRQSLREEVIKGREREMMLIFFVLERHGFATVLYDNTEPICGMFLTGHNLICTASRSPQCPIPHPVQVRNGCGGRTIVFSQKHSELVVFGRHLRPIVGRFSALYVIRDHNAAPFEIKKGLCGVVDCVRRLPVLCLR